MRRLLCFVLFAASTCAADLPVRYSGVVRREQSGAPVSGVRIVANVDPAPSLLFFLGPRTYVEVGSTVTGADGRFELTVAAPRKRLWFMACAIPKIIRTGPHDENVILQDIVLRQPSPATLNVIEVPSTFQPRPKGWSILDHGRTKT
jgi:hypothetical protein